MLLQAQPHTHGPPGAADVSLRPESVGGRAQVCRHVVHNARYKARRITQR
jgi:hypothetical protein